MKLIFCEGLRDSRFIQAVISFFLKGGKVSKGEIPRGVIDKLMGRVEEVYDVNGEKYIVINARSMMRKILKDRILQKALRELKNDGYDIIFVVDEEYKKLKKIFDKVFVFEGRVENFVIKSAEKVMSEEEKIDFEECFRILSKYMKDKEKCKVQIIHAILSGECDLPTFIEIFKRMGKVEEVDSVIRLL